MPNNRGFLGRLRDTVSRAANKAIEQIEHTAQKAVSSITALFEREQAKTDDYVNTSEQRRVDRDEANRAMLVQAQLEAREIREAQAEVERELDEFDINEEPQNVRMWFTAVQDVEYARELAEYEVEFIPLYVYVANTVNDTEIKLRKTPHATPESAIEYAQQIPRSAVMGITKKGNFYYVIVANGSSQVTKRKSRKSSKRKKRTVSNRRSR